MRNALFGFVTKDACVRRTDRQNYDSQGRASIAASHRKNTIQQRKPKVESLEEYKTKRLF